MPGLTTLLDDAGAAAGDLGELENAVGERIARESGARRRPCDAPPLFTVQTISLDPNRTRSELNATVNWVARRVRESGARTFEVALRRQSNRLVLTAEWPRPPGAT